MNSQLFLLLLLCSVCFGLTEFQKTERHIEHHGKHQHLPEHTHRSLLDLMHRGEHTREGEHERKHEGEEGHKHENMHHFIVLTESGLPCKFPFRFRGKMFFSCIRHGNRENRLWCATTYNYDRDRQSSFCTDKRSTTDHCTLNPCRNGGTCQTTVDGFQCVCTPLFTGQRCQKEKCYEASLLKYFNLQEKWLRLTSPKLEECQCTEFGTKCHPIKGQACTKNPCMNGGRCTEAWNVQVCGCQKGYVGEYCGIDVTVACYKGNGTSYRGTVKETVSGNDCIPWDSDLLFNELYAIINSSAEALALGLGRHSYCRNPDKDDKPWCYTLKDNSISWEYCKVPKCKMPATPAPPVTPAPAPSNTIAPPGASVTPAYPNTTASRDATVIPPSTVTKAPAAPTKATEDAAADKNQTMKEDRTLPQNCGERFKKRSFRNSRIVGGMVALPASHPYIAALYMGKDFCGGSLIAPCWVVTAAHCLASRRPVSQIRVVLGQEQFNRSSENSVTFEVQEYILHEKYNYFSYNNDIALLRLKKKDGHCAEYSHFIQLVCLPDTKDDAPTNTNCEVAGWGHMYEEADQYAENLQEASIPIIPQNECTAPEVYGESVTQNMLCAGYLEGQMDACQGDSGGPLVCEVNGRMYLYGIVSWGEGCANMNKPGAYTRVTQYIDWIKSKINPK